MDNKQILENFWSTMATNDFYAASQLLHDDYILEWPQSGERIRGRDNFAAINTFYPAAENGPSTSITSQPKMTWL